MCAAAEAREGIVRAGGCSMGRCSALTRRYAGVNDGLVNRGPARRCVWPVAAPAGGIVRAGAVLRSDAARARGLCSSCAGRAVLSECFMFGSCRSCVPVGMSCVRLMSAVRFYWDVLAFVRAGHAFLSGCLMFDHACCLPPVRQTGRLAGCFVPVPPWVVIAGSAFSNRRCGYPAL